MDLEEMRNVVARKINSKDSRVFWGNDDLNDYINQAYLYYWQWMVEVQHYMTLKAVALDLVQNVSLVPLPDDFMQVRLLYKKHQNTLKPIQYRENYLQCRLIQNQSLTGPLTYSLQDNNILLSVPPEQNENEGLYLIYFYMPEDLVDDADEPVIQKIYHRLICANATVQAKEKEEGVANTGADLAPFVISKTELEKKFLQMISKSAVGPIVQQPYEDSYAQRNGASYGF